MLQTIVDNFKWLIDLFKTLYEFALTFINGLLDLIKYIGSTTIMAYEMINLLPPWLVTFATVTVTILVLYIILGRRAGGNK